MVLRRVVGMMMGCLGMSCLKIADQSTRPAPLDFDSPSSASDDAADSVDPKSSSSAAGIGKIKLSDRRVLCQYYVIFVRDLKFRGGKHESQRGIGEPPRV